MANNPWTEFIRIFSQLDPEQSLAGMCIVLRDHPEVQHSISREDKQLIQSTIQNYLNLQYTRAGSKGRMSYITSYWMHFREYGLAPYASLKEKHQARLMWLKEQEQSWHSIPHNEPKPGYFY